MQEIEFMERLTKAEERTKSNTHRLEKIEKVVDEIHTMSNTMIQLVQEVKHTNEAVKSLDEKVGRIDGRVDEMERLPAEDMKGYRRTAAAAVISVLAGALAAGGAMLVANYI